jgi:hypothetical protein
MAGSGYFKGEKKKPKKDKDKKSSGIITGGSPVFSLPKVIQKKRTDQ